MKLVYFTYWKLPALLAILVSLAGCAGLSERAEEMIGVYYQPTVSENEPIMELESDGSCIIHAIKPGVLSYTVRGKWNVEDDSLLIITDGVVDKVNGDTTVVHIGAIPTRMGYAITDYNGLSLTLNRDGNDYLYVRRGHNSELESAQPVATEKNKQDNG